MPLALLAFGSAGAQGTAQSPGASARSLAIKITTPTAGGASTSAVSSPPNAAPATGGVFSFPADGSVLSAQSTTASATTDVQQNAAAKAETVVTGLSLFGGDITADAVSASASAGTGVSGAGGNANGSGVTNLVVIGQPVTSGTIAVGNWGQLVVGNQTVDRTAPAGTKGYEGVITELDLRLTADHGGLPAGSEIQMGYAEVAVQTAPPTTTTAATTTTTDTNSAIGEAPSAGDSPRDRPKERARARCQPLDVHPKLTAGHYVFPVYGPTLIHRHLRGPAGRRLLPPRRRHLRPARAAARRLHGRDDLLGRLEQGRR